MPPPLHEPDKEIPSLRASADVIAFANNMAKAAADIVTLESGFLDAIT
ncbi:MAG: hypothetical protein WBX25_02975 [Rhodomicrobium sp.]